MHFVTRTASTILTIGVTAGAFIASAPTAFAAPADTGSAGISSGNGCGSRSTADRSFLRESYHDDASCKVQDSAIQLAQSECQWLDAHGNSARNHIILAEQTRDTLDYPYTFLGAAIDAYCPWNQL
ncbi:DUF732 domain-containing protein [Nocardia sp. NPDC051030]|uniref:DUF732 domain-containing protein n=1 Tax=Nocardia sp. NPDC051030 TaxID=3155162 RepID=UPI0034202687